LTKVLETDPKDFSARFNRALAYESMREYDKAIADYCTVIEGDTDFSRNGDGKEKSLARTHHYRGRAYQWYKQENAKAVADYTEALRLDPQIEMLHYRRGQAYNALKEYAKAKADFVVALERDPDYPNLLCAYAWQLATSPDAEFRDAKKALELAQKANQKFNWKVAAHVETLAAAYAESGEFEEAVKWQKKALELFVAKAKAHPGLHKAMQARLKQYETGKPFRGV
jgi:tetratricopeptide (TPR) repeat protein